MELVILVNGVRLEGEQAAHAQAAALDFFAATSVTPEAAARASWELEGALEHDVDYEVSEERCRAADVWAEAPYVIAEALRLPREAEIDLELHSAA